MAKVLVEKRKGLFTLQPLYEWFAQVCDGMYHIEVKRMRKPRSNDQNGWLWGCIYPMLLDALLEAGWEIVEFPTSTATMDTLTFSTYCEKLREYGREYLGIEIPDPDKYWRTNDDTGA